MQLTEYFVFDEHSPFPQHLHPHDQPLLPFPSRPIEATASHPINNFSPHNQLRFYHEQRRLYTVSYHLWVERQHQKEMISQLNRRINTVEDRLKECKTVDNTNSEENRAKRLRRTAEMIEKKYKCKAPLCGKSYGAQGSLQQHIKIKHPELYTRGEESYLADSLSDSDFSRDF